MAKLVIGNTKTNGVAAVVVSAAANLGTKTITVNGEYNASSDSLDGYSSVTVNVPPTVPIISSLSITPSTSAQTFTATGGVDGYSPINVSAVDNTIDANITAGNIKSGVTILGVTGTLPTVSEPYLELEVDNGTLRGSKTTSRIVNINGATTLGHYVLARAYSVNKNISGTVDFSSITMLDNDSSLNGTFYNSAITGVDLSGLTRISGTNVMYEAFRLCSNLVTLDLSSLTRISGMYSCRYAFDATGITTLDLSSLTEITNVNAAERMFARCYSLASVDVSSLATINAYSACAGMFANCTSLVSFTFTALTNLNNGLVLDSAFSGCTALTSLSFPALTSTSFGTYNNQFTNMLSGCTGVTIHFPSNLDPAGGSTVISSKTGYPNFGGSNTTLAFDLTATS